MQDVTPIRMDPVLLLGPTIPMFFTATCRIIVCQVPEVFGSIYSTLLEEMPNFSICRARAKRDIPRSLAASVLLPPARWRASSIQDRSSFAITSGSDRSVEKVMGIAWSNSFGSVTRICSFLMGPPREMIKALSRTFRSCERSSKKGPVTAK